MRVCGEQNNPPPRGVGVEAAEPHRQAAIEPWGRPATKGCMQPATGSAQSINLPMSNLWRSDRPGHRQHVTDGQTHVRVKEGRAYAKPDVYTKKLPLIGGALKRANLHKM